MKSDLLTKDEIARELSPDEPLSTRSVERYIALAEVSPEVKGSGRGKQARYARADVEKIKAAYSLAQQGREEKRESTALTTTKPAALSPVALVAQSVERQSEGFKALSNALDTWPIWLTKAQALERTGLPESWFDAGVKRGELQHTGEGRGRRFHRDDLRAFAESVKDGVYLKMLLSKESPQS
jgi:hypothetical protein